MVRRERLVLVLILALAGLSFATGTPNPQGQRIDPKKQSKRQSVTPPVRELEPAGTIQFGISGPGIVYAGTLCDADGNAYIESTPSAQLAYEDAREGRRPPLTKLSIDSRNAELFRAPFLTRYSSRYDQGFYVGPRGDVYALVQACPYRDGCKPPHFPVNLIVKYDGDASVDSVIKLTPPSDIHLLAFKFAAFRDGNFLVTGLVEPEAPHSPPSRPFTGMFGRGGSYLGPLVLPNDVAPPKNAPHPVAIKNGKPVETEPSSQTAHPAKPHKPGSFWIQDVTGSLIVGSLDGNIYLLRASSPARLYSISSDGRVLDEHLVRPPKPGVTPLQASPTKDGKLFVEFSQPPTGPRNPKLHNAFALLDPQTGKIIETYDVPSTAGIPACMDPQNELLFLRASKSDQLEVAKYVAQ